MYFVSDVSMQFPLHHTCYHATVATYHIYGTLPACGIFIAFIAVEKSIILITYIQYRGIQGCNK